MTTNDDVDTQKSTESKPSIGELELLQRGQRIRVQTDTHDVQAIVDEEDELTEEEGHGAMILVYIRFPGETGPERFGQLMYWTEREESSPVLGFFGEDYGSDEVIQSLEVVSDE